MERRRLWLERHAVRRLVEFVRQTRPGLIVHTHFLAAPALRSALGPAGLDIPQMTVVTDVDPHRWWYCEDVARWFVAHPLGGARLETFGVPASRVEVAGMPIHPKWTDPLPAAEAIRAEWRLPPETPVVLLGGGADFTCGPVIRIARNLATACPNACVVVLGGRNKSLLARLASLREARSGRIVPMGFTDRIHELVEIASLMVVKAGGMTTAECLAKGRAMVFLNPVPGQERDNAEFFAKEGAGVITHDADAVIGTVQKMLQSPESLAAMGANARRLYRPGGKAIAEAVKSAVREG
jgi:processive 1,2-diacylglycerol beta-glucosyltransferase